MTALILFGLLIGLLFGPAIQFYLKYLVVLTVRARMKRERAELFDELFEGLPPDAADLEPTPTRDVLN